MSPERFDFRPRYTRPETGAGVQDAATEGEDRYRQELIESGINPERFTSDDPAYVLDVFARRYTTYASFFGDPPVPLDPDAALDSFLRENPGGFAEALRTKLNFDDPETFEETGALLGVLRNAYVDILWSEAEQLDVHNYDGGLEEQNPERFASLTETSRALREVLEHALRERSGSYLLYQRAKAVHAELFGDRGHQPGTASWDLWSTVYEPQQGEPYELSKGVYAAFRGDELLLVPSDVSKAVQEEGGKSMWERMLLDPKLTDTWERVTPETFGAGADAQSLYEYHFMLSAPMRERIEKDFDFRLADLSIREQFYLLDYLKTVPVERAEAVKTFVKEYGIPGLRTFLSLEHNREFGDELINFSQRVSSGVVRDVFATYSELIDRADDVEAHLVDVVEGSTEPEALAQVRESLLERGTSVLQEAVAHTGDPDELRERLSHVDADAAVFAAAFRALRAQGGLALENLRNTTFETTEASALRGEEVTQMERLFRENYPTEGERAYPPAFVEEILSGFRRSLENPNTRFYVLRHRGTPIGFCRFDERHADDGQMEALYFGSFNVDRSYGNGKLGEAILESALARERQHGVPVEAHCDPRAPISQKYIEWGFVARGVEDVAGVSSFSIVLDDTKSYAAQALPREEALPRARLLEPEDAYPEFAQGEVLTRLLAQDGRLYGLFEEAQ